MRPPRRKDPLTGGLSLPLSLWALGGLVVMILRPTRELDASLWLLDWAGALAFVPAGFLVARRSRAPVRPLLVSVLVAGALRLLLLSLLRLSLPEIALPGFGLEPSGIWLAGALAGGSLGVAVGAREGFSTIFLYEARLVFRAPVTWVMLAGFSTLSGAIFVAHINEAIAASAVSAAERGAAIFTPSVQAQGALLLFLAPVIALRYAPASGSPYQALPVGPAELTLGRFSAALLPALLACLAVGILPLTLGGAARVPLYGALAALLGLALLSAAACALALLFANLGRSTLGAGALGLFFALSASFARDYAGTSPNPWMRTLLGALSVTSSLEPFTRGLIDSRAVIYFASLIALGLFFAIRLEDARRWL